MPSAEDISLDDLSRDELQDLRKRVDNELATYDQKRRQNALAEAERAAKEHGYSLDQLLGKKSGRKRAPQPPRYAHPENPSVTWSGMGRQPAWVREHIENGGSKEDLAVGS